MTKNIYQFIVHSNQTMFDVNEFVCTISAENFESSLLLVKQSVGNNMKIKFVSTEPMDVFLNKLGVDSTKNTQKAEEFNITSLNEMAAMLRDNGYIVNKLII